jgi:hypothetical protein
LNIYNPNRSRLRTVSILKIETVLTATTPRSPEATESNDEQGDKTQDAAESAGTVFAVLDVAVPFIAACETELDSEPGPEANSDANLDPEPEPELESEPEPEPERQVAAAQDSPVTEHTATTALIIREGGDQAEMDAVEEGEEDDDVDESALITKILYTLSCVGVG